MDDHEHEHEHNPEWARRYGAPNEFDVGEVARADQMVAHVNHWLDHAVADLRAHVEQHHDDDPSRCAAYCANGSFFENLEEVRKDDDGNGLMLLATAALHRIMQLEYKLDGGADEEASTGDDIGGPRHR